MADAQSSNKLIIPFDALQPWVTDISDAWRKFIDFIKALGLQCQGFPADIATLEREWADSLNGVGRDPAAHSAVSQVCLVAQKLTKMKTDMACGQKQAYEKKWLRPGLSLLCQMLDHLAHNNTSIVGSAVAELVTHLVTVYTQQLVQDLSQNLPKIEAAVLEYVQPNEQIEECLAIANTGSPAATPSIGAKVALAMAKHFPVKSINLVTPVDTVAGMMPALRAADGFAKEVKKMKGLVDTDSQDVNGEIASMCGVMKGGVVLKWALKFQIHLDANVTGKIPRDDSAVVSTQVTNAMNQVMFTRSNVLLMQVIDETAAHHRLFKQLGLVEVLQDASAVVDEGLVGQLARIDGNIKLSNEYALAWDACDLVLNKLPSGKHRTGDKVGYIRECQRFVVLRLVCSCVWWLGGGGAVVLLCRHSFVFVNDVIIYV